MTSGGQNRPKYVYCAGVFDILHGGHTKYLENCKALGDVLVVGLVNDEGVSRYKHKLPTMNYKERYDVVRAIRWVDQIVEQNDTDPTSTLERLYKERGLTFDIMVRADDYDGVPPGSEFIEKHGGKVIRLPYSRGISSSEIKRRILIEKLYGVIYL